MKNKKPKMPILPNVVGVIIPKQNEFISLQCLGPFYSYNYDTVTLMGLLGGRSYIVAPSSDYCSPILQDICCSCLNMETFENFQEIMSKKCKNSMSVLEKMGQGSRLYYIQTQNW